MLSLFSNNNFNLDLNKIDLLASPIADSYYVFMQQNESTTNAIMQYHRMRLVLPEVKTLGWRDAHTQESRFAAFCRWGDLNGSKILDLGCGYGDLKYFLDECFDEFEYIGVDLMPEFIATARQRFAHVELTHFIQMDFSAGGWPPVDVIFASGSLNYRSNDLQHPYPIISQMWEQARLGIAFNLLDDRKQESSGFIQAYDPVRILGFCRQLDPHAELLTDYHPEDFTILMRKL